MTSKPDETTLTLDFQAIGFDLPGPRPSQDDLRARWGAYAGEVVEIKKPAHAGQGWQVVLRRENGEVCEAYGEPSLAQALRIAAILLLGRSPVSASPFTSPHPAPE